MGTSSANEFDTNDVFNVDTNNDSPFFGSDYVESADDDEDTLPDLDRGDDGLEEEDAGDDVGDDTDPESDVDDTDDDSTEEEEESEGEEEDSEEDAEGDDESDQDADKEAKAEGEEEDSEPKQEDDKRQRRSPVIPRTRFDQVNNKLSAANQRIQELEQRLEQGQQVGQQEQADAEAEVKFQEEIVNAQDEIYRLNLDGDTKAAAQKQVELNRKVFERERERARAEARAEVNQSMAEREYTATVSKLEGEFPFINPDNGGYDQTMVNRVQSISRALIREEGYSPAEALQEATETVAARYYPDLVAPEPAQQKPKTDVAQKKAARKQQSVEKKVAAAQKQPRKMPGERPAAEKAGRTALNLAELSESEFDAISATELKRLRGDIV